MAYDASWNGEGRDPRDSWCRACKRLIEEGQATERVTVHGHPDLSGLYHQPCSKPFSSLAHALNMLGRWSRF